MLILCAFLFPLLELGLPTGHERRIRVPLSFFFLATHFAVSNFASFCVCWIHVASASAVLSRRVDWIYPPSTVESFPSVEKLLGICRRVLGGCPYLLPSTAIVVGRGGTCV
ncbi:hypothetical protein T440DRAFT_275262 [Plenodomus tracheiphilus IPT5]|uniref:Secreted protein n=1 Tax=Plenodomus tracheiphilus IPT5 TaxID=1408161 RepID=A0A6A7BG86_9PLEO|nr:hypothetical protein T440DRAFT_275262 [Plenodomus tracheiphilus IPT5]